MARNWISMVKKIMGSRETKISVIGNIFTVFGLVTLGVISIKENPSFKHKIMLF